MWPYKLLWMLWFDGKSISTVVVYTIRVQSFTYFDDCKELLNLIIFFINFRIVESNWILRKIHAILIKMIFSANHVIERNLVLMRTMMIVMKTEKNGAKIQKIYKTTQPWSFLSFFMILWLIPNTNSYSCSVDFFNVLTQTQYLYIHLKSKNKKP